MSGKEGGRQCGRGPKRNSGRPQKDPINKYVLPPKEHLLVAGGKGGGGVGVYYQGEGTSWKTQVCRFPRLDDPACLEPFGLHVARFRKLTPKNKVDAPAILQVVSCNFPWCSFTCNIL